MSTHPPTRLMGAPIIYFHPSDGPVPGICIRVRDESETIADIVYYPPSGDPTIRRQVPRTTSGQPQRWGINTEHAVAIELAKELDARSQDAVKRCEEVARSAEATKREVLDALLELAALKAALEDERSHLRAAQEAAKEAFTEMTKAKKAGKGKAKKSEGTEEAGEAGEAGEATTEST